MILKCIFRKCYKNLIDSVYFISFVHELQDNPSYIKQTIKTY